jgi:hypothetical protein
MSTRSLEELKEQSANLTSKEKVELAEFLTEQANRVAPSGSPSSIADETKRRLRKDWMAAHR